MTEANKSIATQWNENLFNRCDFAAVDALIASEYRHHVSHDKEEVGGPEVIKQALKKWHSAFPDLHFTIEKMVAEGDTVAHRWLFTGTHKGEFLGVPATGRRITFSGTGMLRVAGGKIVESWSHWDALAFLRQVGKLS